MKSLFMLFTICFIITLLLVPLGVMAQASGTTMVKCPLSVVVDSATANAQLVAVPTADTKTAFINGSAVSVSKGKAVHICTVDIIVKQDVAPADFGLISGTGTVCATGPANITPQFIGTASVIDKYQKEFAGDGLVVAAGKAVCLKLSATPTKAQAFVTYFIGTN